MSTQQPSNQNSNLFPEKISSEDAKTKKFKRFVLDPFQIFCLENREQVNKLNPTSKTFEITSILSAVWRNLPENQKQHYHMMAVQLKNNKCMVTRKRKPTETIASKNVPEGAQNPEEFQLPTFERLEQDGIDRNMIDYELFSIFESN